MDTPDTIHAFWFGPAADDAGDEAFEPPRMMRQESNVVRPSFMRRMMGAKS